MARKTASRLSGFKEYMKLVERVQRQRQQVYFSTRPTFGSHENDILIANILSVVVIVAICFVLFVVVSGYVVLSQAPGPTGLFVTMAEGDTLCSKSLNERHECSVQHCGHESEVSFAPWDYQFCLDHYCPLCKESKERICKDRPPISECYKESDRLFPVPKYTRAMRSYEETHFKKALNLNFLYRMKECIPCIKEGEPYTPVSPYPEIGRDPRVLIQ